MTRTRPSAERAVDCGSVREPLVVPRPCPICRQNRHQQECAADPLFRRQAAGGCVSAWGVDLDRRGVRSIRFNTISDLKWSRRRRWGSLFGQNSHQALMKYDRAWVMKSPRRSSGGPRSSPRGAAASDRGLVARVEIAAQRLRQLDQRVTVLGIGRLPGKRLNVRNLKSRPKTIAALNAEFDVPSRDRQRAMTQMVSRR